MDVRDVVLPPGFWRRVERAPARLLALDHDGTIAPFRVRRAEARAPLPRRRALGRLAASGATRLAIVSGRPAREVARLVAPVRCLVVGEHGWETLSPEGVLRRVPLPPRTGRLLARAQRAAEALGLARLVERKRSAIVLHVRGLPRDRARRVVATCAAAWSALAREGVARVAAIDGGVEMRAVGRDKGVAMRELMDDLPPRGLAVFVGDDATDEDAFRALGRRGFGLLAASRARPTRATGRIAPAAVTAWLEEWLARTSGAGARGGGGR